MERNWKFGDDLYPEDNILDNITFEELITSIVANEQVIDENAVKRVLKNILSERKESMDYLLENNMKEIINTCNELRNGN